MDAPPAARPQTRAPRALALSPRVGPWVRQGRNPAAWPGGLGGGSGREAGGSLGPRGQGARLGSRPPAFCLARSSGQGEEPRFPAGPRARTGRRAGVSAAPRRPRRPGRRLTGPGARPAVQGTGPGSKWWGRGSAGEQGEASGVLNASRVRLIIKLIKASI